MRVERTKRPIVDCLPATVQLTLKGKARGTMRAFAAPIADAHLTREHKLELKLTNAAHVYTATLPEAMACAPGVWRVCLEDDCFPCDYCDIELVNECRILSCEVTPADPTLEEPECPCP